MPPLNQLAATPALTPEMERPAVPLLAAEDLCVSFPAGKGQWLTAVEDVSLTVSEGETLGIVGESGCGKTTVARCLAGLLRQGSGTVSLRGELLGPRRTREQHRAVQLVFQDPYSSLNPRLSVRSVLSELLVFHGLAQGETLERRCQELMALVGLPADAPRRLPLLLFWGANASASRSRGRSPSNPKLLWPTSQFHRSTCRSRPPSSLCSPTSATGSGSGWY